VFLSAAAQGVDVGVSQLAQATDDGDIATFVWNFPIDVTFKSTNPHGWPRLVVTVVSRDIFHRYVVRGYGSTVLPTCPGRHIRDVRTFTPSSSSLLQQIASFVRGDYPQVTHLALSAPATVCDVTVLCVCMHLCVCMCNCTPLMCGNSSTTLSLWRGVRGEKVGDG
jgi:B9 domain-containing protein 1